MASKPIAQCFIDDLNLLIDKYREQGITFCEMIGAFEIIKSDIMDEMRDIANGSEEDFNV